jgi:hypothetical protein
MDRGYLDFARLFDLNTKGAFFVIRARSNTKYRRRYSHPTDKSRGIQCDQTVALTGVHSATDFRFLYDVLFFMWIKQHLRIKSFYNISENAVKIHSCISGSVYVLVAIIKKRLDLKADRYTCFKGFELICISKIIINTNIFRRRLHA